MVHHEAERLEDDAEPLNRLFQAFKKSQPVAVLAAAFPSFIVASCDVVDGVLEFDADGPCHVRCLARVAESVKQPPQTPLARHSATRNTLHFARNTSDVRS